MPSPLNAAKNLINKFKALENKPSQFRHDFVKRLPYTNAPESISILESKEYEALKHDIYKQKGFGSLLELPFQFVRKRTPLNKFITDEKYDNVLHSFYEKGNHLDQDLAAKLINATSKTGKFGKFIEKKLTTTDYLPMGAVVDDLGNKIPAYVPTETARISAPASKIKDIATPILAFGGAASILERNESKKKEVGQDVLKNASLNEESFRELLLDKIASAVVDLRSKQSTRDFIDMLIKEASDRNDKLKEASEVLKKTSGTLQNLQDKVASLTEENKTLKLQVLAKERSSRATKLANDMFVKGMIKKSELEDKVDYIMDLSDESFDVLNQTVQSVPTKKADSVQKGLDKLSFMLIEDSDSKEPDSLQQAILNFRKNY